MKFSKNLNISNKKKEEGREVNHLGNQLAQIRQKQNKTEPIEQGRKCQGGLKDLVLSLKLWRCCNRKKSTLDTRRPRFKSQLHHYSLSGGTLFLNLSTGNNSIFMYNHEN